MPVAITTQGDGFKSLAAVLNRFGDNISDFREAFSGIADVVASSQRQNFASGGGYYGFWTPLSPKYAAWKAKNYPGKPILTLTGALRTSMTSRPMGVEKIGSHSMELGTTVPYAKYHQRGTGNMPARPIINRPTSSELRQYGSILHRHALKGVAA